MIPVRSDKAEAIPSSAVLAEAADWFARLRDGRADHRDHSAWQAWLLAAEAHRIAWRQVEEISRDFAPLRDMPDTRLAATTLSAATTRLNQRRRLLASLALAAGGGLIAAQIGAAGWRPTSLTAPLLAWTADHRSGFGQQREVVLADGSRVWQNSGSAFNARFNPDERRLVLVDGEILVATAPDPGRDFVVDTDAGRLKAVGTRFGVRREGSRIRLSVFEGAVEIRPAGGTGSRLVPAGQQAHFDRHRIDAAEAVDLAREAWTRGRLIASHISLGELVRELGHYRRGLISVADEVADLTVYGSFPLRDTDATLRMLASALPIRVHHPFPGWTRLDARH